MLPRTINDGMAGEWAAVNDVFKVGDIYKFDVDQFRRTNDANLNKLIAFFDELETLMNSLATINAITEEDLEDEKE